MSDTRNQTGGASDTDPGSAIAHLPALDGVRGVAILLVLFHHFGVAADFPHHGGGRLGEWGDRIFFVGWSGVDLFFVLSGFLISSILLATRSDPLYFRRFYGRRVLRIFPLYYVAIVLGTAVVPHVAAGVFPEWLLAYRGQVWLWTYTLNFALVFGWGLTPQLLGHFWTLAIEEQYYVFWPWIVRRTSRETLLRTCIALIVGALALRIAWAWAGLDWSGAYRFTLCRVDAFGIGGLIALLAREAASREWLDRRAAPGLAISGAALSALFLWVPRFYPSEWLVVTFGHSLLAIASGCLIILSLRASAPRWLVRPSLRALGKYSYGIYVWHWPLQRVMWFVYTTSTPPAHMTSLEYATAFLLVGIGGSSIAGWASYRLIEAPFLRLKRVFAYTERCGARSSREAAPETMSSTFRADGQPELTKP